MSTFILKLIENLPGMVAYRGQGPFGEKRNFLSDGISIITGFTAQDFLKGDIQFGNLIHPEDASLVFSEMQKAIQEGRSYQIDYRVIGRNGQITWVMDQGIQVAEGAFEGLILDIDTRKKREIDLQKKEIELQNKVKEHEKSASTWSHELRNPIAALMLQTTLLEMDLKRSHKETDFPPMLKKMVEISNRQLSRLNQLVDSIREDYQSSDKERPEKNELKKANS